MDFEWAQLALGAIAAFIIPGAYSQESPPPPEPVSELSIAQTSIAQEPPAAPKRHRITCNLLAPEDLKVSEDEEIAKGQLLCDRTQERQSLESRRNQLQLAMKQLSIPLEPIDDLPPPNFAVEEQAIASIKAELSTMDNAYIPQQQHLDDELAQVMEPEVWKAKAKIQEGKLKLAIELNEAVAKLDRAKGRYQREQYRHTINQNRQQISQQEQQFQIARLSAQIQDVEQDLAEITAVRSPYAGKIRRTKVLGQADRTIQVEITINTGQ